jgi:hypothetical protein
MFFNVVCYCGVPVGYLWRKYQLAKLLSFSEYVDEIEKCFAAIGKSFKDDQEQVIDFIHVSMAHLRIFQVYDKKKAVMDLVN